MTTVMGPPQRIALLQSIVPIVIRFVIRSTVFCPPPHRQRGVRPVIVHFKRTIASGRVGNRVDEPVPRGGAAGGWRLEAGGCYRLLFFLSCLRKLKTSGPMRAVSGMLSSGLNGR